MLADILGTPLQPSTCDEQAGRGAAMSAGIAVVLYADARDACNRIVRRADRLLEPTPENERKYQALLQIYREAYQANKPLFEKLSCLP